MPITSPLCPYRVPRMHLWRCQINARGRNRTLLLKGNLNARRLSLPIVSRRRTAETVARKTASESSPVSCPRNTQRKQTGVQTWRWTWMTRIPPAGPKRRVKQKAKTRLEQTALIQMVGIRKVMTRVLFQMQSGCGGEWAAASSTRKLSSSQTTRTNSPSRR